MPCCSVNWGRAHSLREICGGLASVEGKLNHPGAGEAPSRSTLSYANAHRPWQLFEAVFGLLLQPKSRSWLVMVMDLPANFVG
ncbi:MAG: hypothetical protein Fur0032_21370 [Terrimicrobiaceae bacterium]